MIGIFVTLATDMFTTDMFGPNPHDILFTAPYVMMQAEMSITKKVIQNREKQSFLIRIHDGSIK